MSFFAEIKRRNLLRVGIAYAVVAWLLLQVSATLVPALLLPAAFHSGVALLLILGFPVALVFAWAFELTPEGLKTEQDVDRSQSPTRMGSRTFDFVIIGLFAVALLYFVYDKFMLDPQRDVELVAAVKQDDPATAGDSLQGEQPPASIAVLAFANMSDESGSEYFSDGLSEELLNLLVKIPEMHVAARTSSFSYKGTDTRIAQIGEELNVAYVLEGSVRRAGNRIRITAQLIKADDGFHLWSETFDRNLDDIFAVQDEVAAAVVSTLKVKLIGAMPTTRKTDPEVYSLYLQGKYFHGLGRIEDFEKAVAAFKQALALDPEYAPAWIDISKSYQFQIRRRVLPREVGLAFANDALDRALAIDNNLAAAWAGKAYLMRSYDWDWAGAQKAIDRALQLEPGNPNALGVAASLANTFGQISRCVELFEQIVQTDPLRLPSLRPLGSAYYRAGRYDDAIAVLTRVVKLNPNYPTAYAALSTTYLLKGDLERAMWAADSVVDSAWRAQKQALIHLALGNREKARSLIEEFRENVGSTEPYSMANFYARSGDHDAAFESLEKAYELRASSLAFILANVHLALLRNDPRYPAFLEKLGLLEAWQAMPPEYQRAPETDESGAESI